MLKTLAIDTQAHQECQLAKPERHERTVFIEAQAFLDFKYGSESVDIMFPDGATAKLVIASSGRIYFQVPSED